MIHITLQKLDDWFNEPEAQLEDRPKLLSKLALLEVCGWIEGEFDRLIRDAEAGRLNDAIWCEKNVVRNNSGFHYEKHLRKMFVQVFGEYTARKIEVEMEVRYPGELARLGALLATLWEKRCSFAHADFAANVAAQKTFDAPSWCIDAQKTVRELVGKFELCMVAALP